MQFTSTVTTKGQVVIPAPIRNKLNIKPNDRVIFSVYGTHVIAQKAPSTSQMYGYVKTKAKLTDKELENAINKATEDGLVENV